MYFLGIDGGGSATRAVVIDAARHVLGRGVAGPSNHYSVGPALAAQNCASAAAEAIRDAQRLQPDFSSSEIVAWGFGLAGVRREADVRLMHGFLSEICSRPFALDTDVVAAHAGAFAGSPGIVVSAGTGAIVFGADEFGEKCYADGWGPLLGDEGGGYWIGVEALRAACRALDGRSHPSRLADALLFALDVPNGDELIRLVYSPDFAPMARARIAGLAQVVFQLADEGVAEAADVRARAASLLSRGVRAVARCLLQKRLERGMDGREIPPLDMLVALRGGLFEDDFMRATLGFSATEAMVELKRDFLPIASWRVVKPQHDASVGAAILAQLTVD